MDPLISFKKPASWSIDQMRPTHSLLSQHLNKYKTPSRLRFCAAPAFATLDVAHHSTAATGKIAKSITLGLKSNLMRLLAFFRIINKPVIAGHKLNAEAVRHINAAATAAIIGVACPLVGLVSRTRATQFYKKLFKNLKAGDKGWNIAKIAVVSVAVLAVAYVTYLAATQVGKEMNAHAILAKTCRTQGPDHFSCRVDQMAAKATSEGYCSNAPHRFDQSPAPDSLNVGDFAHQSTLEHFFGQGRKLNWKDTRGLYENIIHSRPMTPAAGSVDGEAFAAAASNARTAARMYTRSRGGWFTNMMLQVRDLFTHGGRHGPSYARVVAKNIRNFPASIIESATRSNAAFTKFAKG